jgi:flavin-dependent dehydrogenase
MTSRRIEIIGGGLAGLSLGIALLRQQVPVTLYEAGSYPRHRVCGEFIAGLDATTLDRLGISSALADALRHEHVAWFTGEAQPQLHRLPAPALGISRFRLDARLADLFVQAGGVLQLNSRSRHTADRPGRVFATGRRRATASRWLGLKVHVRHLPLTRELEMHLGRESYVGLAQIEDGAVNVCGLFRLRDLRARGPELLLRYLDAAGLTALASRLRAATVDPDSFCAVAGLDFDRRVLTADRVGIGDVSAMIPPFTGNGMAMAFQSAALSLDPLLAFARGNADWSETARATNAALRGRFRMRLASADALHPFLLQPTRQRWFAALSRARLLPFRPLYATLH